MTPSILVQRVSDAGAFVIGVRKCAAYADIHIPLQVTRARSTSDACASSFEAHDLRYEMLSFMLHIIHAQNRPNPASTCA